MDPSPDELLRGLAAGDAAAFAAVYDRFAPALVRTAWGLLGCREEAEDAVQDVFVGLVRSGAGLGRVRDLKNYLFAALRHAALRRRGRRPRLVRPLEDAAGLAAPEPPAAPEIDPRLERALRGLPEAQREVVVLKVDGGLTFAELAAILGVSANTAASRYRYALEKLRAALGGNDDEPGRPAP